MKNVLSGAMSGQEAELILKREVARLEALSRERDSMIETQGSELVTLRGVADGVGQGERDRLVLESQSLREEVAAHRRELEVCNLSLEEAKQEYASLKEKCDSRRSMLV